MTEQQAATAVESSSLSPIAAVLGRDILSAIVNELKTVPDHWHRMNEDTQKKTIARLQDRVQEIVTNAVRVLVTGSNFQAVAVKLEGLNFKDGIKGGFSLPKGAPGRHELADAIDKQAVIVLADPSAFFERMKEVKADGATSAQIELFGGNYDPTRDQPAYRRDEKEDRLSPARTGVMSWADLMAKLNGGEITKEQAEQAYGGELPAEPPSEEEEAARINRKVEVLAGDGSWTEKPFQELKRGDVFRYVGKTDPFECDSDAYFHDGDKVWLVDCRPAQPMQFGAAAEAESTKADKRSDLALLLEKLWAIRVTLSLGTLQTFTPQQIAVTREWADAYAEDPEHCKIARPHFLPMPDAGAGDDDQQQAAEG